MRFAMLVGMCIRALAAALEYLISMWVFFITYCYCFYNLYIAICYSQVRGYPG
jgi:hypothetical protein